jgi:hypothetical protein
VTSEPDPLCVYVDEYLGPCSDPAEHIVTAACTHPDHDWKIGRVELCMEHILEVMEVWHNDDDHDVKWHLGSLPGTSEGLNDLLAELAARVGTQVDPDVEEEVRALFARLDEKHEE